MTEYFSAFPHIEYQGRKLRDITIRLDFLQRIKDNVSIFQFVQLSNGERPEDVATKYYGDSNLYWIILYINDIVDPYHEWLLTDDQLYNFVIDKYGAENINEIHHYETTSSSDLGEGVWCDLGTPFSTSVTNLSYERELNEQRRKIKLLKPFYINQVIKEYLSELK